MTRRERVNEIVDEVLRPLLEADGAGLSITAFEEGAVTIRLEGRLAGCPGASYVKRAVIEPAIASVASDLEVRYSFV